MSLIRKKTKFVLFTQGRSGSTLLRNLINAHPDIQCDGEIFILNPNHSKARQMSSFIMKNPESYIETHCRLSERLIYGFSVLDHQLHHPEKVIKQLYLSGWKIVSVSRNDILAQCFSNLFAQRTNLWHRWTDKPGARFTTHITIDELTNEINWWMQREKNEGNILEGINPYHIVYEDNLQDQACWPKTTQKLFEYLGANPFAVTSALKKTYSRHYSEIVENFDALMDSLSNTAFSHLIPNQFKSSKRD